MPVNKLQDDLLHEFRASKNMIINQIELFEPLAASLRKPAARRLVAKGLLVFAELLCWLLALGAIAFAVFLNKLYPFYILFQLRRTEFKSLGANNILSLQWAVYGLIGLIALLIVMQARMLRRIRLKNDVLSLAGRDIKTLVGQHLSRKAAIDAIEQRHFDELPLPLKRDINDIPNPGFEQGSIERII